MYELVLYLKLKDFQTHVYPRVGILSLHILIIIREQFLDVWSNDIQ